MNYPIVLFLHLAGAVATFVGGSIVAVVAFVGLDAALALPAIGRLVSGAVDALARLERASPLYRR